MNTGELREPDFGTAAPARGRMARKGYPCRGSKSTGGSAHIMCANMFS